MNAIAILLIAISASAQQGDGARQLLAAPAPAKYWTWDSNATRFAAYTGSSLALATNRIILTTNRLLWRSNTVLAIAPITPAGVELSKVYWPSNRIGQIQWQMSSNFITWKTGGVLEVFTNQPVTPKMFLRLTDVTTGWLPPK